MKFGIRLPNSGPLANRANIVQVAEKAESLGFHSIWVHDHILWGTEQHKTHLSAGSAEALDDSQKPNFYESITTLAYLAGMTKRVKLGIAVLVLPLRNPLVVAKQLANLDILSEGRLIVGVAPGAPNITKGEFEAVGSAYEQRGKITDDYIVAIKKLWNESLPSHQGKYTSFKDVQMFPKPVQNSLKILIGGGERGISERALKRAVDLGDGWIPAYLTPEEARDGIHKVKSAIFATGKHSDEYLFAHEMFAVLDQREAKARELASKSLLTNFESIDEGLKRSLVGTPEEVSKKLEQYQNAGVDLTELKFVYPSIPVLIEMMDMFAEKVLPSFKP
jgi:probable F420-dependent oxidoreductase